MKKFVLFIFSLLVISCSLFDQEDSSGKDGDIQFLNDIINLNNLNENSSPYDKDNGDSKFKALELGFQKWENNRLVSLDLTILDPVDTNLYNIHELPKSISKASKLRYLVIHNSDISTLPDEIFDHPALWNLHLWGNQISNIPVNISSMSNLEVLQLGSNRIKEIPSSIINCPKLSHLYLSNNEIDSIPVNIWDLKTLKYLSLNNNRIKSLPDNIDNIPNIYEFNFAHNELKILPTGLEKVTSIAMYIDVSSNYLYCSNGLQDTTLIPTYARKNNRIIGLYNQRCDELQ